MLDHLGIGRVRGNETHADEKNQHQVGNEE
jgi:hypothetical protein